MVVIKRVFSVILVCVFMLCFSIGAFGLDIVSKTQDPKIEIDGRDIEDVWTDSSLINFDISPDIGSWLSLEMFNYQNTIYGIVAFNDAVESDNDLVVRIDFYYEKYSAYIIFVMQKQLVIFESDSLVFESEMNQDISNYRAEFSLSTKQTNKFSYGDLIQIEVKYGCVGEIDDYTEMSVFYYTEIHDCYIGGYYIEDIEPETLKTTKPITTKTTKPKTTKTTKKKTTKTTKKKTTKATTTVVNHISDSTNINSNTTVLIDDTVSTKDLTIIITVATIVIILTIIFSLTMRKTQEGKNHNYTDEDKGSD